MWKNIVGKSSSIHAISETSISPHGICRNKHNGEILRVSVSCLTEKFDDRLGHMPIRSSLRPFSRDSLTLISSMLGRQYIKTPLFRQRMIGRFRMLIYPLGIYLIINNTCTQILRSPRGLHISQF